MAPSRLGENAEIIMGQSPPGETCNREGYGLPLLNGPTEFGPHHPSPVQFTTDARKLAKCNDVLFCVRGSTTGRMNWADREYAIGRGVAAIRHKKGSLFQPFVRAVIEYGLPNLLIQATGSTFPNVSAKQLAEIWWPPLDIAEQQAIACILGVLDDKIELNRCMNKILEDIAQAIFKSWFVDFDPVRAKAEGHQPPGLKPGIAALFPSSFEKGAQVETPRGWAATPLSEVLHINPKRVLSKGTTAPYLDMASMPTKGPLPDSWAWREFGSGMRFVNGDTLLARITPCLENGKTAFVDFLPEDEVGWGSTEYIVLRPKGNIPPVFAYLLARTETFRSFAIQQMTGSSGRQRVPPASLDKFTIVSPETGSPIFDCFCDIVVPMFDRIRVSVSESRAHTGLRDTLLPKLLSGELPVQEAERIVGRAL